MYIFFCIDVLCYNFSKNSIKATANSAITAEVTWSQSVQNCRVWHLFRPLFANVCSRLSHFGHIAWFTNDISTTAFSQLEFLAYNLTSFLWYFRILIFVHFNLHFLSLLYTKYNAVADIWIHQLFFSSHTVTWYDLIESSSFYYQISLAEKLSKGNLKPGRQSSIIFSFFSIIRQDPLTTSWLIRHKYYFMFNHLNLNDLVSRI